MKSHITIDGIGYFPCLDRGMSIIHAQAQVPYSFVWGCTKCGACWAKYTVEHPGTQFSFLQRDCILHASGLTVPGSVMLSWEPEFNECIPKELLQRELELHLAYWERKHA